MLPVRVLEFALVAVKVRGLPTRVANDLTFWEIWSSETNFDLCGREEAVGVELCMAPLRRVA